MADPLTRAQRSAFMARIRGKDTLPEMTVRRALSRQGVRYRLHVRKLPGTPDIVIAARRIAVQVRGCFWHGHGCLGRTPQTNRRFWAAKIARNRARDARKDRKLRAMGWRVRTVWECRVYRWSSERLEQHLAAVIRTL